MDVAISGASLRALHRSIGFLSRVGPELLLDAHASSSSNANSNQGESLSLKAVNASRSAFARVRVAAEAFDRFEVRGGRAQTCVLAKHAMASMRSRTGTDATELSTKGEDDADADGASRVRVRTKSAKSGTTKTYEMCVVTDAEHVDADLAAEDMPVKCVVKAKTLNQLLSHFASAAQEDVTITCASDTDTGDDNGNGEARKILTLSSYSNPNGGLSQALQTSIALRRDDESILHYRNTSASKVEVTVNLKDLRSMVHLCESSDVDVALYCAQTGAPVLVKPTADFKIFHQRDGFANDHYERPRVDFEAELVLASMLPTVEPAVDPSQTQRSAQAPPNEAPVGESERPAPLQNAPLGSQPWSAIPDSEEVTLADTGVEIQAQDRPWGAADTGNNDKENDWLLGSEEVEATPPEKRRRS